MPNRNDDSQGQQIPGWVLKVAGSIMSAVLVGAITWMTYMSKQQSDTNAAHAELKVQIQEMEKRFDQTEKRSEQRYTELRADLRSFVERIETKIDRIGRAGIGIGANAP